MPRYETLFAFFVENITFIVLKWLDFTGDDFSVSLVDGLVVWDRRQVFDLVRARKLAILVPKNLIAFSVEQRYSCLGVKGDKDDFDNIEVLLSPVPLCLECFFRHFACSYIQKRRNAFS